jgi:succinate dehydrogenase / fumarate reductase flavoprotein subunit
MGKSSGDSMIKFIKGEGSHKPLPKDAGEYSQSRIARLDSQNNGENVADVGNEMRRTMQAHCGVFRFPDMLVAGVEKIKQVAERADKLEIKDKSKVFNTARIEALELQNLIEVAKATMISAEARKETRGAHDRADFHDRPGFVAGRDDQNWLKHTLWYRDGNKLDYKPVNLKPLTVESFEPKARVY